MVSSVIRNNVRAGQSGQTTGAGAGDDKKDLTPFGIISHSPVMEIFDDLVKHRADDFLIYYDLTDSDNPDPYEVLSQFDKYRKTVFDIIERNKNDTLRLQERLNTTLESLQIYRLKDYMPIKPAPIKKISKIPDRELGDWQWAYTQFANWLSSYLGILNSEIELLVQRIETIGSSMFIKGRKKYGRESASSYRNGHPVVSLLGLYKSLLEQRHKTFQKEYFNMISVRDTLSREQSLRMMNKERGI